MRLWPFGRAEARDAIENPAVPLNSAEAWAAVFQSWASGSTAGAVVTVETALGVPAVFAAVSFLSRTMATLPLHAYRMTKDGSERIVGGLETLVNDAPNGEWTSYDWREYLFWQVFTEGRGLSWIERSGTNIMGVWPMETNKTTVELRDGRRLYRYSDDRGTRTFAAADVIDVTFALQPDRLRVYSPINKCRNAIGLSIAMETYAGNFFQGGGVPPLALVGPLPQGPEAFKRAQADINRAVKGARDSNKPIFPIPVGHELKPVGFEPEKGQMTEARRMQIEEIARAFQLPPVFLQDLTRATFSNAEQQDLHLVKHLIGQWAKKLEQQLNLKLFGQRNSRRYIKHNLDGLLRGDFVARMNALAQGVQNAILEPNEARALEDRPARPFGDNLLLQGAMTSLEQAVTAPATIGHNDGPPMEENDDETDA